jgi:hypothetical protein
MRCVIRTVTAPSKTGDLEVTVTVESCATHPSPNDPELSADYLTFRKPRSQAGRWRVGREVELDLRLIRKARQVNP